MCKPTIKHPRRDSESSAETVYEGFAPYYDLFTSESDYERWTGHVLAVAREHGAVGPRLLDLACGTGKSFLPFLARGFEVTGCDASRAMLAEAARKAPEARLEQVDIRDGARLGEFDLVTCFDDSLNYLIDERDLTAAFRSVSANLRTDGLALFDLNSLLAYRTTFASDRVTERDGIVFAWRGEATADAAPGCRATARIDVFAPRADGSYERVSTIHAQRHHPLDAVVRSLERAGLECLSVYGVLDDGSLVSSPDELHQLKVLFVVRPRKGGVAE
jgi:SAM-dependent methyltransferase